MATKGRGQCPKCSVWHFVRPSGTCAKCEKESHRDAMNALRFTPAERRQMRRQMEADQADRKFHGGV